MSRPTDCQAEILRRQQAIDADGDEAAHVREAIEAALRNRGHDPATCKVLIPSATMAEIVEKATGEKRATNRASAYLTALSIPTLRKSNTERVRGWLWGRPRRRSRLWRRWTLRVFPLDLDRQPGRFRRRRQPKRQLDGLTVQTVKTGKCLAGEVSDRNDG